MEASKPKYFPVLNGLRVILASMVFVYHYSGLGNYDLSLSQIFIVLRYRMALFFVLSGFVVTYSLLPKLPLSAKEYFKFLLNRLLRLFPLYLALLVVPYLQLGLPNWPVFLTNITLTKGFFEKLYLSGIGPAWTLTTEITFYVCIPLILKYVRSVKSLLYSYLLFVFLGLLLTGFGTLLTWSDLNPFGFFSDIRFTLNITFFGRATEFFAGIITAWIIYHYTSLKNTDYLPVNKTYMGLFLVLLSSLLVYVFDNSSLNQGQVLSLFSLHVLLPVSAAVLLYGLINEVSILSRLLSHRWLVWLGNGSYAFYLMHTGWVQFKIDKINPIPDNGFILLWLTAMLVYYFFEKPIITFFRKKLVI